MMTVDIDAVDFLSFSPKSSPPTDVNMYALLCPISHCRMLFTPPCASSGLDG